MQNSSVVKSASGVVKSENDIKWQTKPVLPKSGRKKMPPEQTFACRYSSLLFILFNVQFGVILTLNYACRLFGIIKFKLRL